MQALDQSPAASTTKWMRTFLVSHCLHQKRVRIDRFSLPPPLLGAEFEDREMKMRCVGRGVPRCPDVPYHVAFLHEHPFFQAFGITIEMRVIVAIRLRRIELINGETAGPTREELGDDSCVHGDNRCPARRQDIGSLMPAIPAIAGLRKCVLNIRGFKPDDRQPQSAISEQSGVSSRLPFHSVGQGRTRETWVRRYRRRER